MTKIEFLKIYEKHKGNLAGVGRHFGFSRERARQIAARYGLKGKGWALRRIYLEKSELNRLALLNYSIKEAALFFKVSRSLLGREAKKFGITFRNAMLRGLTNEQLIQLYERYKGDYVKMAASINVHYTVLWAKMQRRGLRGKYPPKGKLGRPRKEAACI